MSSERRYTSVREFVRVVRYEWRTRKAWRDWKAALRGTYWWLIRRYPCELCQGCGRRIMAHTGSWWHADDDLWLDVHGSEAGTLCPRCFTEDAKRKGISVYWQATVDERPWVDERPA